MSETQVQEVKVKKEDPKRILINDPALGGWLIEKRFGEFAVWHPEKKNSMAKYNSIDQCLQHTFEMLIQEVQGEFTVASYQAAISELYAGIMGTKRKAEETV